MADKRINFHSFSGNNIEFLNPPNQYPVNDYQSLVLAAGAEVAALALAYRNNKKLSELKAWEPCCGGGPVALSLKAMGLGYVQASDLNDQALNMCKRNAQHNNLDLDNVIKSNLLDDGGQTKYDLICFNPPCGVGYTDQHVPSSDVLRAVDGGIEGMSLTMNLFDQADKRLSSNGSIIFICVSTGNISKLTSVLNERYRSKWRVLPASPVAAPWRKADNPQVSSLKQENYKPFIWTKNDGWVWRLSWVIEVSMNETFNELGSEGEIHQLPLHPYGYPLANDVILQNKLK